jgi:predicted transcriptional regulator
VKVAISVPDPVFEAGERIAKRLKVTRSRLYTRALKAYVGRHGRRDITEQLNSVYAGGASKLDPVLEALSLEVFRREPW